MTDESALDRSSGIDQIDVGPELGKRVDEYSPLLGNACASPVEVSEEPVDKALHYRLTLSV